MADTTTTPDTTTTAPEAPPPAPPQAPSAPTTAPKTTTTELPPEALGARLEREREAERKRVLADLGITDVANAKAALDAYAKLQREQMTEVERLRAEAAELTARAKRADELEALAAAQATAAIESLSEAHQKVVRDLAGDDPASQMRVLTQLRASGLIGGKPPIAAPATTAPPASAPTPGAPPQVDRLSTYEAMRQANPVEAARYFSAHAAEISAARKQRSG